MQKTTKGLINQDIKGKLTTDITTNAEMTKATEGLRVKFEKTKITEGPGLEVNMVDLNQPAPKMEEVERRLKWKMIR